MATIALLGWGSLLWDKRPEFDDYHGAWESGGPDLPLEFSRVSETRGGALTLVIDEVHGKVCKVSFARSTRRDPEDAICDLRSREGTTRKNVGFHFADGSRSQSRSAEALKAISAWAKDSAIDVVVWTDLQSNFSKTCGVSFSVEKALEHLEGLSPEAKENAAQYVWRAPDFVRTPLREKLASAPWFKQ